VKKNALLDWQTARQTAGFATGSAAAAAMLLLQCVVKLAARRTGHASHSALFSVIDDASSASRDRLQL